MNAILKGLADQVTASETVEASAVTLINGFAARQQAAIDKAIADGASADDLAGVQAEVDAMKQSADALAAAITANTPAAPVP